MHGRLNLEEVLDYIFETVCSILLAQSSEERPISEAYHQLIRPALEPCGRPKEQEWSSTAPEISQRLWPSGSASWQYPVL